MTRRKTRGYGQFCALAKALDVIGDRWTLLIVRELLLRGPCRYSDLRSGLPGIATNLLVDRLRDLDADGLIRRERTPMPGASTVFRLTSRGEDLRSVVHAIGRWGGALLKGDASGDVFCSHWIGMPFELHLVDRTPDRPPVAIEVRTGDQPMIVETVNGAVRTRPRRADDRVDVTVSGPPPVVVALLTGRLSLTAARRSGVRVEGTLAALQRVRPRDIARPAEQPATTKTPSRSRAGNK